MYKLSLSEVFACRLNSEAYSFLSLYPRMIDWWLARGQEAPQGFSDFSAFRSQFYSQWKEVSFNVIVAVPVFKIFGCVS
jgi:hypothetical protein